MLKHLVWQIKNILKGLGDKIDDWTKGLHQTGMHCDTDHENEFWCVISDGDDILDNVQHFTAIRGSLEWKKDAIYIRKRYFA